MKEDMLVLARYKDAPEDEWFEVLLTDDHRMIDAKSRKEITRTDMQFMPIEGGDVIDMEDEWEDYRMERLREDLHDNALYLAEQARSYKEKE